MNRRDFLYLLTAGAAAAPFSTRAAGSDALGPVLPMRTIGDSGIEVTSLGLGGFHIGWTSEELAQATIEAALEEGIRFFDTAESYGPHTSEQRYGRYLIPKYRDKIFLMTKSMAKDGATARQDIEDSLRRLRTDHVDLWQIHSITTPEDVDKRLEDGVLEAALKAQAEGKITHIGFTGHASPYAMMRMLERTGGSTEPFLACQFPVNPVDAASPHSFVETVMPAAQKRGLGVLAMKTLADGRFFGEKTGGKGKIIWETENPVVPGDMTLAEAIGFAYSLPISVLITGAEKPEYVRDKAAILRQYAGMSAAERQALIAKALPQADAGKVEYYKLKELRQKDASSA